MTTSSAAPGRLVLRGSRSPGDIAITGGHIAAVGDVVEEPGDRVLRCDGDIVTSGFVNAHHHLSQRMTRGRATASNLFDWLQALRPAWDRLTVDDVRLAAVVGLAELATGGCTTTADHHLVAPRMGGAVFEALVDAARQVGVRLHLCRGAVDRGQSLGGLAPDSAIETTDAILRSTEEIARRFHDGEWVSVAAGPTSVMSVTPELMRGSVELAAELGLRLHTHLGETVDESERCLDLYERRPLELLSEWGWLGPTTWLAHGIHLDPGEIALLAEAGTAVAHCPSSNCRLASGICQVTELERAGVPVGLGVDGAASNEGSAVLQEIRLALYLARVRTRRADALSPDDALRLATEGGARCLGRDDIGKLEVGRRADLAVWPAADLEDIDDPITGLVLAGDRKVRHLVVAGGLVVEHGEPLGVDLGAARAELAARAREARVRAG